MGVDAEMFVRTRQPMTPEAVRRLSGDLAASFGAERFWIDESYKPYNSDKVTGQHALEIITEYTQDGPDILPEPGEQFIQVHLWTRYYGEGYERGDIGFIILVAMWLESRIAGGEVWYGGDSSGICAIRFDTEARAKMWKYFAEVGHEPYRSYFGQRDVDSVPHCDFCDRRMHDSGGGRGDTYYSCAGCGKRAILIGKTEKLVVLEKDEDFFVGHKRLVSFN